MYNGALALVFRTTCYVHLNAIYVVPTTRTPHTYNTCTYQYVKNDDNATQSGSGRGPSLDIDSTMLSVSIPSSSSSVSSSVSSSSSSCSTLSFVAASLFVGSVTLSSAVPTLPTPKIFRTKLMARTHIPTRPPAHTQCTLALVNHCNGHTLLLLCWNISTTDCRYCCYSCCCFSVIYMSDWLDVYLYQVLESLIDSELWLLFSFGTEAAIYSWPSISMQSRVVITNNV